MPRSTSSGALPIALAQGVAKYKADLFTFTLAGGAVYRWTSWTGDLKDPLGVNTFTSANPASTPWIERGGWRINNTMAVPDLDVTITATNASFAGGLNIKQQIVNGLFDGASCLLQYAFMANPGDTAALGTADIFAGVVSTVAIEGTSAKLKVKGKNNILDQMAPRHVYQLGCNHAFCDAGCTLNRVSFTTSYSVGSSPTNSFIPWASAPANPSRYISGTLAMTSGVASGQSRTITKADSTGLTLAYPLYVTPAAADTFTAFEGCNKQFDDGAHVQDCTARSNTVNYDGFKWVPPPTAQY